MGVAEPNTIDTLLLEERRYSPPEDFASQANATADIYEQDFEQFWEREGRERVTWFEPFTQLYEWKLPYAKWYIGGKLNVCFNCVDRHVGEGKGSKVAYYWEGEPEGDRREITYADLQREVVRFANALKKLGVKKGTPVAIYMGMVPELAVAMLACTRLGAPHTVVFGHTPRREILVDLPYKIGIDTGCVYGGRLTAVELTEGVAYQVARGERQVRRRALGVAGAPVPPRP